MKAMPACGTALKQRQRVIIEDIAESAVFTGSPAREAVLASGARAVQSTPLCSRSGHLLGMLSTHYKTLRRPDERDLLFIDMLSQQTGDMLERARVEEELRKSEERFRIMADSIPQLAWIARADGHIYWYNQRWYEYTGTTPEQMEGWGWQSVHDPDALPGVLERWKESIATGKPFDMVFPLRGADGSFREFLTRIMPVKNADGDLIQWCGTNTDITERKHAEARLTADLAALTRMHALSGRLLETGGIQSLLQEIMDAAVSIVGAEKGTLQLLEGDSLRIVAAHGHRQPFLQFFASAENQASVCGEATRRGERVVVSDVETSSLFIGTPSLAVLREAGVRAVQSTPMMSRNGALLGILTTQWGVPYTPDEHDLWRIDLLVRQAADLIDHSRAEEALLKSRDELELRVSERTAELNSYMAKLEQSNQALQDFASHCRPRHERTSSQSHLFWQYAQAEVR